MQDLTTYFDNTRYDNLTSLTDKGELKPDGLSAKPAKLSAFAKLKAKTDAIKSELASQTVETQEQAPKVEIQPEANVEAPATPVEPKEEETPKYDFPSKELLESKINEKNVTIYNNFSNSDALGLGRKLRVGEGVRDSLENAKNVVGVEYIEQANELTEVENTELETKVPEVETKESVPVEEAQQEPTFDFSALPGVDGGNVEPTSEEEPTSNTEQEPSLYEDNYRTEQDDRLNDYLNRENYSEPVDYSGNFDELDEIRKLKREILEAKESLMQVKQNVGELQQKDNTISEQLAAYKRSLMQERDAVNAELVDQTREWNDLTQLVRQKEALMGDDEESYGMGKAA